MDKISVKDQSEFISQNTESFFQVFLNPTCGQIISVKETQVDSILAINFVEPQSIDWNWIASNKDTLFALVKTINNYFFNKNIDLQIQTFYIDSPPNKNTLNGSLMGTFVIGFNKRVNTDSKNFMVVFDAIKDSIVNMNNASTQTTINNQLMVFCITKKQVGFIKDVNGELDSVERWWYINFLDGSKIACYRREFFVVGDKLEILAPGGISKILVKEITFDDINFHYEVDDKIDDNLDSIKIDRFKTFTIKVLDPNDDISSVASINQPQPKVDPKSLGVDFDFGRLVEVIRLEESSIEPKDEVWSLSPIEINDTYNQLRSDFFVVGDVVSLTSKKNSDFYQKGKVISIDDKGFLTIDIQYKSIGSDYGNHYFEIVDLLSRYHVEIIEYFDLKEDFNSKKPKIQNSAPQIQTQSIDFDLVIEDTKKEIGQLIFLRSLQSPLDFEENIKINQLISEKQKQLDKLIFEKTEMAISQDNVFDDLFEQSFTPIQNTYNNIFVKDEGSSDFFTPNGSRSLFNDAQNSLIRTPLFLDWFGEWQLAYQYKEAGIVDFPCSKVLSPNFEPQVVWHGTGAEFSYFRFDNFPAAYFAVNQSYSQWFADLHSRDGDGFTIPFFLNVRNPLDLTMFETKKIDPKTFFDYMFLQTGLTKSELEINPIFDDSNLQPIETWMYLRNNPKMLKKLSDTKIFDGIHFYETNPGVDQIETFYKTEAWIIFDPQQAKLADPSRGVLLFSSLKSFLLKKGGKI